MSIEEAILSRLNSIEENLKGVNDKPMTIDEASAYLDCSKSYLYKLTSAGEIHHYKPSGKRVYFMKKDLDSYILRNPVKSQAEHNDRAVQRLLVRGRQTSP